MDDHARPHRARVVTEFLEGHGIERMEWPARSPDLNQIEHVCDMMGEKYPAARSPSTWTAAAGCGSGGCMGCTGRQRH